MQPTASALDKEDLSDEEFLEFICNLQKCNLAEIFEMNNLQKYVDLGVFSSIWDNTDKLKTASKVLPHTCSPRCLVESSTRRETHRPVLMQSSAPTKISG